MNWEIKLHSSIKQFKEEEWQRLCENAGPFLQFKFLDALENTGCVGGNSGWQPAHFGCYESKQLKSCIPGYVKYDSAGEYIFDHGWANAYHQYGLQYYPKWISAIPFTPVTGQRWLGFDSLSNKQIQSTLQRIEQFATSEGQLSSNHWLFVSKKFADELNCYHYLTRTSVQFQWFNRNYTCFSDFLAQLTARKRKDIKKTRQRLEAKGVHCYQVSGQSITSQDISFFYSCYKDTYLNKSGHEGYLNLNFFQQLVENYKEHLLLIIAKENDSPVASSLLFFDHTGLYGRYWGCTKQIDSLHFECCYYQGIEFAIANKLPMFNPGTQGEHKILRGFEPIYCYSLHKLKRPEFQQAIGKFLAEEAPGIKNYFNQAEDVLPFNQDYLNKYKPKN